LVFKMKILTVIGARPQFIKASAVSREIKRRKEEGLPITEILVHTGQHYDRNMSYVFFQELNLPEPNYYLGVGAKNHGKMTGEMMAKLEEIMLEEKPNVVLVYGDTNSTLAGAVTASKLHIPVAHVEAGLRSFNMDMPEEINRVLTDRVSKWLFCPTEKAVENLKREGFENFNCKIVKTGDVMYDVALYYRQFSKRPQIKIAEDFVVCTIHREENTENEDRLKNILEALEEIGKEIQVILPLHPRTRKKLKALGINPKHITITEPVSYLEMLWLLTHTQMVLTDSGGLQKEAFFFKKPCITLRDETEWVELVENGFNVVVGSDKEKIIDTFKNHRFNQNYEIDLYGKGDSAKKIVDELLKDKN